MFEGELDKPTEIEKSLVCVVHFLCPIKPRMVSQMLQNSTT